jgi:hypothetical protein
VGHAYTLFCQDKINAFWEITKKDIEDKRAELRNKDREMEEMEERHQVGVCHSSINSTAAGTQSTAAFPQHCLTRCYWLPCASLYLQVEIKVYKQKVKHLLYEHQNNITTLKADGELALKLQQVGVKGRLGMQYRSCRYVGQHPCLRHG